MDQDIKPAASPTRAPLPPAPVTTPRRSFITRETTLGLFVGGTFLALIAGVVTVKTIFKSKGPDPEARMVVQAPPAPAPAPVPKEGRSEPAPQAAPPFTPLNFKDPVVDPPPSAPPPAIKPPKAGASAPSIVIASAGAGDLTIPAIPAPPIVSPTETDMPNKIVVPAIDPALVLPKAPAKPDTTKNGPPVVQPATTDGWSGLKKDPVAEQLPMPPSIVDPNKVDPNKPLAKNTIIQTSGVDAKKETPSPSPAPGISVPPILEPPPDFPPTPMGKKDSPLAIPDPIPDVPVVPMGKKDSPLAIPDPIPDVPVVPMGKKDSPLAIPDPIPDVPVVPMGKKDSPLAIPDVPVVPMGKKDSPLAIPDPIPDVFVVPMGKKDSPLAIPDPISEVPPAPIGKKDPPPVVPDPKFILPPETPKIDIPIEPTPKQQPATKIDLKAFDPAPKVDQPPAVIEFGPPKQNTPPASTAQPKTDGKADVDYDEDLHSLKQNETFRSLSKQYYNSDAYALALQRYNSDHPGRADYVRIPPIWVLEKKYASDVTSNQARPVNFTQSPPAEPAPRDEQVYVVSENGEMLADIARKQLGSEEAWQRIWSLNPKLNPAKSVPGGTRLRLPRP